MKRNLSSLFWGVIFILAGLAFMADRLGWIQFNLFSTNVWVYIFAAAGLLFLLGYFISGFRRWGLLFPALLFGAVSLTIWMVDRGLTGSYVGMPIMLGLAVPFYVGYFLNRRIWGLLIPAWIMTVLAFVTLTADLVNGNLIGAVFLFAVSAPFLVAYLLNRSRWWALIPAWATFILGVVTLLSDHVNGNLIGALFLYAVALPFLVVYLSNRAQRWALIVTLAVAVVGTLPLLASVVGGDWTGAAVMLLFSAAFFFVYFRWQTNWWALIPAGVFASICLVVLLGILIPQNLPLYNGLLSGILLTGFGLTFGGLWLLRAKYPTAWARYPAIGLLIAALVYAVSGGNSNIFWAAALLAGGILLVVWSFMRRKSGVL